MHYNQTFKNQFFLLFLLASLSTGCLVELNNPVSLDSANSDSTASSCSVIDATLSVAELYSGYTRWNDYVQTSSTSSACGAGNGGAGGYTNCIHAGERRKVDLPSAVSSCSNVTASDSLGAFNWRCDDSGMTVYVYSYRLKEGKGLADLIDASTGTSFNNNSVSISINGCETYQSTSTNTWWTNTLSVAPGLNTNSRQTLNTAYSIYTIPTGSSASTEGFLISADGIGLVTLGSEVLSKYGDDRFAFAEVNNSMFAWIEGNFNGAPTSGVQRPDDGIAFYGATRFSRIHNAHVIGADDIGIIIGGSSQNNLVSYATVESTGYNLGGWNPADFGLISWGGTSYNTFYRLRVANQLSGPGVSDAGADNVWSDINVSNTQSSSGFGNGDCCGGDDTIATQVTVISSSGQGINFDTAQTTLGFFTVIHSSSDNVRSNRNDNTSFNGLVIGATSAEFRINNRLGNQVMRLATYATTGYEIQVNGTGVGNDDNRFTSELWTSSTNCQENGTGPSGNWLDHGTCNYGSSTPVTTPATTSLNMENVILGRVATDSASPQDSNTTYASVTDFTSLDSFYRGWGKYTSSQASELHHDHAGNCGTGDDCAIYDARLSSTSNEITNANGTFSASSCPSSVDAATAANVIRDKADTVHTFLLNAVEIMLDGIGNDNGLCESSESCIFAPHVGSYQGEGDYLNNGVCEYTGGNGVTNYKIYGYPTTEASE